MGLGGAAAWVANANIHSVAGAKGGVTMDQQANMEELIHHFVSHSPEGEPCVLPMRSISSSDGEGRQATPPPPPWWMRDHANKCHLGLLITTEEEAEVMHAALSISITTVQSTVVSVMVLLPPARILIS